MLLVAKQTTLKTHIIGQEGVATKRLFFIFNLCFAKCEKLSFFGGAFLGQILVDVQKTL